jgi:hypothetical protein
MEEVERIEEEMCEEERWRSLYQVRFKKKTYLFREQEKHGMEDSVLTGLCTR